MKKLICFIFLLINLIFVGPTQAKEDNNAILFIYTNIGPKTSSTVAIVEPSNFAIKIPFVTMGNCEKAKAEFERNSSYEWKALCFDNR